MIYKIVELEHASVELHNLDSGGMYPRAHSLSIPTEIRLEIYRNYVMVDCGYVYDHISSEMTISDGSSIDLGLSVNPLDADLHGDITRNFPSILSVLGQVV